MINMLPGVPGLMGQLGALSPSAGAAALAQGGLVVAPKGPHFDLEGVERGGDAAGQATGLFGRLLDDARQKDVEAQGAIEAFSRGDDPGRIHETMVAVSKAEIALRTVAAVRNKLLDAYRDLQHVTA